MLKCRRPRAGFSLLELVITISVLAVGLTVVLQAMSYSARVTRFSNELIQAVLLGQDIIQELEFKETKGLLKKDVWEGRGEKGFLQWSYGVSPYLDFDSLQLLDLRLTWKSFTREQELDIKTMLRP